MPVVQSYSISSVPFYDTRQQQYIKILCVNVAPTGPLATRVKVVRPPRLSGFQSCNYANANHCNGHNSCIHAITAATDNACYLSPDDLPELFAFLATNGYTVDLGLTKLAAKHQSNAGSLVCLVSHST
jgi:hypothetical protein